jgi:DNA segregation ATPase FtsK/SpoIIIE-like protein
LPFFSIVFYASHIVVKRAYHDFISQTQEENTMTVATVIATRRSLLRGAFALFGLAAGSAAAARIAPHARRRSRDEQLYEQAWNFVHHQFDAHGDVIAGPVSLLQREYSLEYAQALELAAQLEQAQVWSVFRDAGGMRCARRQVRV